MNQSNIIKKISEIQVRERLTNILTTLTTSFFYKDQQYQIEAIVFREPFNIGSSDIEMHSSICIYELLNNVVGKRVHTEVFPAKLNMEQIQIGFNTIRNNPSNYISNGNNSKTNQN